MTWWLWVALGFGLLAVELFTPGGFFVMFFGAGAVLVGLLAGAGLLVAPSAQWIVFTVVSVTSLLLLRGRLVSRMRVEAREVDTLVGEIGTMTDDVEPGRIGKAELRGTAWSARNADARTLARGERVRVTKVDGLTITVRAE